MKIQLYRSVYQVRAPRGDPWQLLQLQALEAVDATGAHGFGRGLLPGQVTFGINGKVIIASVIGASGARMVA